ncbi:putative alpha-1,3-mannosyltransferase [Aspergillus undulatus]|uniref:putative alpha-1,3-mannosyltransferase n=1 Tax=Aspergillus undulatus TaxID=1810928 RepID=UPI003CCE0BA2
MSLECCFAYSFYRFSIYYSSPEESPRCQTENLLRPIDATGEARLHELGLRTRYFKKMFEAWEKAHLVFNEDGTALKTRDNILKYLEQHPEIAGHMGMARAKVVHDYKISKWVYNRLSTLLFSWTAPYHKDLMALHAQFYGAERGIVMLAGDLQAAFLFTSISVIRQLGCHLPIEVFHYGDGDLTKSVRSQLEALPGVTTRDLSRMLDGRALTLSGWAGKPFAMLLSTFRHVIFIDADALFFQNPEILLEDEAYRETGALFFKDRMLFAESKRQWLQDVLPKPLSDNVLKNRFWTGESEHMQESGVVVVDKWRHFVALLLVARLNGLDRDGDEEKGIQGVYDMVFGDKETFWLGWELAGDIDYAFHDGSTGTMGVAHPVKDVPGWNGDILVATGPPRYTICAPQLLHLDRHDRPLWFNGWILPTKYDNDGEPAAFETFLQEPREVRGPNAWQLHENNVCCLTSEYKTEFTPEERKTLDDMIAIRRRLGVVGSESDSG